MNFLVDTSVVSDFAPGRSPIAPERITWALANQHRWYLPAIAAMEIQQGIARLERIGSARRAADLAGWFAGILEIFRSRIVDLDLQAALRAGALSDRLLSSGRNPGLADVLIAATAEVHGFAILTRNLRHFEPTGVPAFDPFSSDPAKLPT